jgi:mannose-6-phosphate isomerase-like protein (cupin superfamily)
MAQVSEWQDIRVVGEEQAEVWMEGDECTLVYFHTDKLVFSVSTLHPGHKSALDPGHVGAQEVAYVIQGVIVMEFPQQKRCVRVRAGQAIFIPEGEPHLFYNVGPEIAKVVWCTAPHLGRSR